MTRAALYCRKSTAEAGAVGDEKSVRRQEEHGREYAARKGWTVVDTYVDDGISGAEFESRPAFVRMMTALKPKPHFDVVVMAAEDRLGREMIEVSHAVKRIVTAGVRVFYYLTDTERTLDSPTDKILMAVTAYAGELEREMARQRSRDASRQRAARGAVAGGRTYGYANKRDASGFVVREVVPEEAATIKRIFAMCAAGKGVRRIAETLNLEDAPAPRSQRGRPRGWVPSSVRAILFRPLYRGTIEWGKARKRDSWGKVAPIRRPESEWLRTEAPHLRIVTDAEWNAAHERLATSRANYLRHADGQLWGRPASGVEAKYLLVGMSLCGECGGGLQIYSRSHGKRRAYFYGCPRAKVARCSNDLLLPMEIGDGAAVAMMTDDVLSAAVVERALTKLVALLEGPEEDVAERRARLTATVERAKAEGAKLAAAIAAGGEMTALVELLKVNDRAQKAAASELRMIAAGPTVREASETIRAEALRLMEDWRGLLGRNVSTTRQLLAKLLDRDTRFVLYPMSDGAERWYEMAVTPSLEKLLGAVPTLKKAVASPAGFEPAFWP